jgi:large subunit ribosomal protein LP1
MGVFTFVCRSGAGEWNAKQIGESPQVEEASAADIYSLQRHLVQAATAVDSSGGVQSSFSLVTPDSAVFQVLPIAHL